MRVGFLPVLVVALVAACRQAPVPAPQADTAPERSATVTAPPGPPLPHGALVRLGTPALSRDAPVWIAAASGTTEETEVDTPPRRWAPEGRPSCATASGGGGTMLAAGFDDGTVTLWDGPLPRRERTLVGHVSEIRAIAFAPDGSLLVSASDDGAIRIWDTTDAALLRTLAMAGEAATELRFGDDGRTLLAATEQRIRVWSLDDGRNLDAEAAHLGAVERIAVSSAGWVASSDGSPVAFRWDLQSGERTALSAHVDDITDLAVTAAGDLLATTSDDHTVRFWNDGLPPSTSVNGVHYYGALCADFTASGGVVTVGDTWGQVRAWRATDGELHGRWTLHQTADDWHDYGMSDVEWAPDQRSFATAGDDGVVAVWADADPNVSLARRELRDAGDLAFLPDGTSLLVRHGEPARIAFLDAASLATQVETQERGWRSASLCPSGEFVAAIAADGDLVFLRRADLVEETRVPAAAHVTACSPDGLRVITGGEDGTLMVWDVETLLGRVPAVPRTAERAEAVQPDPVPEPPVPPQAEGLESGETIQPYAGELPGAEPAGVQAVLVLEGVTTHPLQGATVGVYDEPGRGYGAEPFVSARTDEYGLAWLRGTGSYQYQWVVRHPGRAPRSHLTTTAGPVTVLFPAPGVRGRVVDPFDEPLPQAEVQLFLGCGHSPAVHRAQTDATGRFTFPDAEPEAGGMLWISGPGAASEYVDADILWASGTHEPTIVMLPGKELRGVLTTPDGQPRSGWPVWSDQAYRGPLAFTADDGSFVLPGFDPAFNVTLEEPGGSMLGEVDVSVSPGPAVRRVITPTGDGGVEDIELRRAIPWPVLIVDPERTDSLAERTVRLIAPETGAVYTAGFDEELVNGANAILRAPEGRYLLVVGDAFASHVAGPLEVDVQRDAAAPFVVTTTAQPVLDIEWVGARPEVELRLVVSDASLSLDDPPDEPIHLPADRPAALQVREETDGLTSQPRVFEVGPTRNGRRTARVTWTPPRRVRLSGLGDAEDVTLDCSPVQAEGRRDGDSLVFETYAEGTLHVTVHDEERTASVAMSLDGPPGSEQAAELEFEQRPESILCLRLPPDVLHQTPDSDWNTWVPGGRFGPSSSTSGLPLPPDGRVVLDGDEDWPRLERVGLDGWVPRYVALDSPTASVDVPWGSADLTLTVSGATSHPSEIVVWIEGALVQQEGRVVRLRGVEPGKQRILVGAPGCRPAMLELEIANRARRSVSVTLPAR